MLSDLSPTSDATFTDNEAIGTILANDDATGIVTISLVTDATASEENTGRINFKVKSEFTAISPFTFHYAVAFNNPFTNKSASSDDFAGATNGMATIPAGKDSTTISISIATDDTIEPDETFRLLLTNPSANVNLEQTSAVGKILNDDLGEISDATAIIGDTAITLNWTNPKSNIFAGVVIAYQESSTTAPAENCSSGATSDVIGKATSDTIEDLTNGTAYSFRICAKSTTDRLSGGVPLINLIAGDIDGDGVRQSIDIDDDNDGLIEIRTAQELNNMRHNLAGTSYKTSDDDAGSTAGAPTGQTPPPNCSGRTTTTNLCGYELVADIPLSGNWEPIGFVTGSRRDTVPTYNTDAAFKGIFEGNGHMISNLAIDQDTKDNTGLFGATHEAILRNIKIHAGNITARGYTGTLVGRMGEGSIRNCATINPSSVITSPSATSNVGGLVGEMHGSARIMNSYATGSISLPIDSAYIGGLVGVMDDTSRISNSYATGSVSAARSTNIGGLVGYMFSGTSSVMNSYATGSVTGGFGVGGLVGEMNASHIMNSYATGSVAAINNVGGLVGRLSGANGRIMNSYATGSVSATATVGTYRQTATATAYAGGLIGTISTGASISNSYATGSVSATSTVSTVPSDITTVNANVRAGGLVGSMDGGNISNSYATGSASAVSTVSPTVSATTNSNASVGGLVGLVEGSSNSITGKNYFRHDAGGTDGIGNGTLSGTVSSERLATFDSFEALTSASTGWSAYYDKSDSYAINTTGTVPEADDVYVWNFTANRLPILNNKPETTTIFTAHDQYLQQGLSFISATPTAITAGKVTGNSITLSHPAGTAVADLPNGINLDWTKEGAGAGSLGLPANGATGTAALTVSVTRPASNLEDVMATLIGTLTYTAGGNSYNLARRWLFVIAKQ